MSAAHLLPTSPMVVVHTSSYVRSSHTQAGIVAGEDRPSAYKKSDSHVRTERQWDEAVNATHVL